MISFEFSSWSINKFYKSKIFEKYAYVHVYRAFLIMYLGGKCPPWSDLPSPLATVLLPQEIGKIICCLIFHVCKWKENFLKFWFAEECWSISSSIHPKRKIYCMN